MGIDDHVAELAGESVVTAAHPAVGDDRTADSRAQRDQRDVAHSAGDPDLVLRDGGARSVVVDEHGEAETLADEAGDRNIRDTVEVRSRAQHPLRGDESRHSDTDRYTVFGPQRP